MSVNKIETAVFQDIYAVCGNALNEIDEYRQAAINRRPAFVDLTSQASLGNDLYYLLAAENNIALRPYFLSTGMTLTAFNSSLLLERTSSYHRDRYVLVGVTNSALLPIAAEALECGKRIDHAKHRIVERPRQGFGSAHAQIGPREILSDDREGLLGAFKADMDNSNNLKVVYIPFNS